MNLLSLFKRCAPLTAPPDPKNRRAELRAVFAEGIVDHTIPSVMEQFDNKCPDEIFGGDRAEIHFHVRMNVEIPDNDNEPLRVRWESL